MMSVAGRMLRIKQHMNYNVMVNGLHQSCGLNNKWRERHGLTKNSNTLGPLTNLPDYSFKDGRPVPYGVRQRERINVQHRYAERIVKLVGEIDYAVERQKKLQKEEKQKRQQILDSKLKPKGFLRLEAD